MPHKEEGINTIVMTIRGICFGCVLKISEESFAQVGYNLHFIKSN